MALRDSGVDATLLLVGDQPYGAHEVATTLHTDVAGVVAWDPHAAGVLTGTHGAVRELRRSAAGPIGGRSRSRSLCTPVGPMSAADLDPAPGIRWRRSSRSWVRERATATSAVALHRTVAENLSEHLRTLDGNDPLSVEDERGLDPAR